MRKSTILLASLVTVAFATTADAAKRKPAPKADPAVKAQTDSQNFVRAGMQPWTTTLAPATPPRAARKGKAKKKS